MTRQQLTLLTRAALLRAHNGRCIYCEAPIAFCDLEIDHIIPDSLSNDPEQFNELRTRLGLPEDFQVSSVRNLLPTHHHCNRRKSDRCFSESTLRYYLEVTASRLVRIDQELKRLATQAENENILIALSCRIEQGAISIEEVSRFLSGIRQSERHRISEPIVISFCANLTELQSEDELPDEAPVAYPGLCDWLERELMARIRANRVTLATFCEASERNGETLCVRVAAWATDIDSIAGVAEPWWSITELAPFSEVYEDPPDELFEQATRDRLTDR